MEILLRIIDDRYVSCLSGDRHALSLLRFGRFQDTVTELLYIWAGDDHKGWIPDPSELLFKARKLPVRISSI